jgi:hypothetical protein
MKPMLARFLCRILAASMMVLPFQAQAGLIGTDRAAGAPVPANAISRGSLAAQLESFGLSPETARERVAALTDAEIAGLAGRAGEQPAGGVAGLLWIAVIVFLVWRFTASDQAKAEEAARTKSSSKPAPEKK